MDYEVLRVIWWVLLGVLLIGFAVMDGFDMGAAMLLPFVGKTDVERRIIINTFAPVWEGNQVWLILGAGAIFAAWPLVYAVAFSGMYLAMFLALLGLIVRPVALKFRSKSDGNCWRTSFDYAICISSLVPALIFGVAVGNALIGIPFHFDDTLRMFYTGSLFELLNPYSLICGLVSLAMMVMQGGIYILLKVNDPILVRRAKAIVYWAIFVMLALFTLNGIWTLFFTKGYTLIAGLKHVKGYPIADTYTLVGKALHNAPSNPLMKMVLTGGDFKSRWAYNYTQHPILLCVPFLVYVSAVLTLFVIRMHKIGLAFITSSFCIVGLIATVGVTMFPFILPSSTHLNSSLTVWDASSSKGTLGIMLIATLIFVPIILTYTGWVYRVLRGKVTADSIDANHSSY